MGNHQSERLQSTLKGPVAINLLTTATCVRAGSVINGALKTSGHASAQQVETGHT